MKQGFITCCAGKLGRMANGAYQIAACLGLGKKLSLEPVFNPWINHDARDRFSSKEDVNLYRHFVHPLPPMPAGIQFREHGVGWGFHEILLPPGNWNLAGHFQAWKYYDDVRDQLAHYFRMVNEPPMQDVVGVHWRSTDYESINGRDRNNLPYHPRLDLRYYEPAMSYFGSDQKFLVFSDDIPGAKELFRPLEGKHKIAYSEEPDYISDFRRLKTCAHFIVANSSFSSMAAVLGDAPSKQVIAPRPWFGPVAGIDAEDLYEPSWRVLDWP